MVLGMFDCNFQKFRYKTKFGLDKNSTVVYNKIINDITYFHKGVHLHVTNSKIQNFIDKRSLAELN